MVIVLRSAPEKIYVEIQIQKLDEYGSREKERNKNMKGKWEDSHRVYRGRKRPVLWKSSDFPRDS
jgi:hypothetical protein